MGHGPRGDRWPPPGAGHRACADVRRAGRLPPRTAFRPPWRPASAFHGMPASTVHRVLVRHGLHRLAGLDRPPASRPPARPSSEA
ncbi:hypothetical protein E2C00_33105 [Streptomyces sp. WAC05374]|nr:hypothetical protein EF905_11120 [Streptomyces sp. WAC05374]TDF36844.1 hypothetical protein E2B92_30755 [Streptomyces sp. WAC05374]TDF46280.1 hypothetical protein E2C02_32195 [Streptomyces sp. WAC05374]TDF46897.1 hypothetical protein E2C00_33105 [Streptomyces sp. WAC05374]